METALFGEGVTKVQLQNEFSASGFEESLLEFARFDCGEDAILHAMGCSAGDGGLGAKLEEFARFYFQLGQKYGH